jgi:C4-dicarboxylate-specific signal transduction histidine kinase
MQPGLCWIPWSKGQMEQFEPQVKAVSTESLFTHIKNYFAATQNIHFNFEAPAGLTINTDEHYLQTIMHNLTANAVKALAQTNNATITWKAWQEGTQTYLSVTDNGPGINNEQATALYNDKATTGSKFGLGLHIIRDLAKAINCTITLQPVNQGAQFVLAL